MTKAKSQALGAWIFGGGLLLFLIWAFVFGPNELPPHKHLILGLLAASAAGLLGYFITGSVGIQTRNKLPVVGKILIKAVGGAALFVIVLLWWNSDRSPVKKTEDKIDQIQKTQGNQATKADLAQVETDVLAAIAPKNIGEDPPREELSPDLIQKAKLLLERGDKEQQAVAQIALRNHARADEIIQILKQDPINDAFRLLILEGNNWFQAGQYDQAIGPYEQALALRPADFAARYNVAVAHGFARFGDINGHEKRALDIYKSMINESASGSRDWASAQGGYATILLKTQVGKHDENVSEAISACRAALSVFTKEAFPAEWATAQINLGAALRALATGDRADNLQNAIACYEAALTVETKERDPRSWAKLQLNLGNAWANMPTGDHTENLRRAIAAYEGALSVQTKQGSPHEWADTQSALAAAWGLLPTGDREANLHKAIAGCDEALTVFTKDADPVDWSLTQYNLGAAFRDLSSGDRAENLAKAIAAFEAALAVQTKETCPIDWAWSQDDLATAWLLLPTGDRAENLRKAIAGYDALLAVYSREAYPLNWAQTQAKIAIAWASMPTGNLNENYSKAIAANEAALAIYTKSAHPIEWAGLQGNLAIALAGLADQPDQSRAELLRRAIASDKGALVIYTPIAFPQEYAKGVKSLAAHRKAYETTREATDLAFDAIQPAD